MKRILKLLFLVIIIFHTGILLSQGTISNFSDLTGPYLGQPIPGTKPELYSKGIVKILVGLQGNIVFSSDCKEAFWHADGHNDLYCSDVNDGCWTDPREISFLDNFLHDAPCYSHDGEKLYFIADSPSAQGKTENEKFYFVERIDDGWSGPVELSPVFDSFHIQREFSLDEHDGLFFGGKEKKSNKMGDIWYSKCKNGRYLKPQKLPGTINTHREEFSPCIAPDKSYILFNRTIYTPLAEPEFLLYVSFQTQDGNWTEAECISDHLEGINARITPDGKYIFVIKSGRVYWLDAKFIKELKPNNIK